MTQLEELFPILEKVGDKVWANGGTLLRLIREGHLLKSDPDIDLAMWYRGRNIIPEMERLLQNSRYKSKCYPYNGEIVQKSFSPVNLQYNRSATIKLFHRHNETAYSPTFKAKNPHEFPSPLYFAVGFPNQIQAWYLNLQKKMLGYKSMSSTIVRLNSELKTWVIPKKYFERREYLEEFNTFVPSLTTEYLSYRYLDWETSDHDWNYWTDDPALKEIHPDEFFNSS